MWLIWLHSPDLIMIKRHPIIRYVVIYEILCWCLMKSGEQNHTIECGTAILLSYLLDFHHIVFHSFYPSSQSPGFTNVCVGSFSSIPNLWMASIYSNIGSLRCMGVWLKHVSVVTMYGILVIVDAQYVQKHDFTSFIMASYHIDVSLRFSL